MENDVVMNVTSKRYPPCDNHQLLAVPMYLVVLIPSNINNESILVLSKRGGDLGRGVFFGIAFLALWMSCLYTFAATLIVQRLALVKRF